MMSHMNQRFGGSNWSFWVTHWHIWFIDRCPTNIQVNQKVSKKVFVFSYCCLLFNKFSDNLLQMLLQISVYNALGSVRPSRCVAVFFWYAARIFRFIENRIHAFRSQSWRLYDRHWHNAHSGRTLPRRPSPTGRTWSDPQQQVRHPRHLPPHCSSVGSQTGLFYRLSVITWSPIFRK